jgi:hypothetical protein
MKDIFLIFIFLSFVFSSDIDITMDNLSYSFNNVKANYLKCKEDQSYWNQFIRSNNHLAEFLKETYEANADELFQRVEQRKDLYLAHCVLGIIDSLIKKGNTWTFWIDHFEDIGSDLFKRTNKLMKVMVKRQDWANSKKVLKSLLLIQKRFLPLIRDHGLCRRAQKRLEEFEFIYAKFDPDNKDAFLNLFHRLSSLALNHTGNVSKDSLIGKSINLFKVHRYHFLSFDRERYGNISTIPRRFLYSIVVAKFVTKVQFIDILKKRCACSLKSLQKLNCLEKAFQFYQPPDNPFDSSNVEFSLDFITFVRESIDSGVTTFDLNESDLWLLKAILFMIPKNISSSELANDIF